jgi:putative glutamine amidotransferase
MNPRPRILLTTSTRANTNSLRRSESFTGRNYSRAVIQAGGLPVMVASGDPALAAEYAAGADGILFTGGVDLDPVTYAAEPLPQMGHIDGERDAFELALYQAARGRGLPILGICRGAQLINVAEGGTLHQHVPNVSQNLNHAQPDIEGEPYHAVRLEEGSLLARAYATTKIRTNSYHHQAVDRPGTGLRATGHSSDGLIEAIEGDPQEGFLVAVQWHPEMSCQRHPEHLAPFHAFLAAIREKQETALSPA